MNILEARYGSALTEFQQTCPASQGISREYLLRTLGHFDGDFDFLKKSLTKRETNTIDTPVSPAQHREDMKTKYAVQLATLANAGINVNCPCLLAKLEKHRGNVNKVLRTKN